MKSKKINVIILEKTEDHYSAFAQDIEGVYGAGETATEARQSILEAIELLKEHNSDDNIPEALKGEYVIKFQFDLASLLSYYQGIFTNAAMERLTGINQRQIQRYAAGESNPRPEQKAKIRDGLHKLGKELIELEL
jgi:predicted RNase H-like HicB family nuclease